MIDKNFDQITPADITQLTADGVYESQLLEFKRDLPGERGRIDPWSAGGDFTAYARDHLLREVIAFANAHGGTVIVGIDETPDDPPRAAAICPIPRIHDLATRMQNAARACIDPVLPGFRICGIEVGGAAGEGVLLFRTGPSPAGPHRVTNDGHAYIRRGASSVKMTMREIQDLTIDLFVEPTGWKPSFVSVKLASRSRWNS
jgi:predicted HTH transcriptional regulator